MRQADKLIGMLELGVEKAATYPTPAGDKPRTVDKVRAARARLLVPEKRFFDEIWAKARAVDGAAAQAAGPDLFGALWWR